MSANRLILRVCKGVSSHLMSLDLIIALHGHITVNEGDYFTGPGGANTVFRNHDPVFQVPDAPINTAKQIKRVVSWTLLRARSFRGLASNHI